MYAAVTQRHSHCLYAGLPRLNLLQGGSVSIQYHEKFGQILFYIDNPGLESQQRLVDST